MSKITSEYQVSIPKSLPDRMGIRPGDELEWRVAVAALVDTNVLVYRYDPRDSRKQRIATELPRLGDGRTAGCE